MRPSGRTRSVFELRRLPLTLGRRQRERTKQWAEKYGKTHMVAGSVWISHSVVERTAAAARGGSGGWVRERGRYPCVLDERRSSDGREHNIDGKTTANNENFERRRNANTA